MYVSLDSNMRFSEMHTEALMRRFITFEENLHSPGMLSIHGLSGFDYTLRAQPLVPYTPLSIMSPC